MTKPLVQAPDAEELLVELLEGLLAAQDEEATVGIGVPAGWTPGDTPHVQVAWDGTPSMEWPVYTRPTVRIVARAETTEQAKRLAAVTQGLLLAHMGGEGVTNIRPGVGIFPGRDEDTQAEIAWFTVLATIRTVPLDSGS